MDMVIAHPVLRGADIDFKLSTWEGPRSHQVQVETGFGGLAVKQCKELVTLGVAEGRADHVANTGVHLSPQVCAFPHAACSPNAHGRVVT